MLDEKDISKLLRLKRFEQPPPGYFDDFLREFQARQREELLKQPLWRIAVERIGAFFSDHSTGRLAYGGAAIAVLAVATVLSIDSFPNHDSAAPLVAEVRQPVAPAPVVTYEGPTAFPVAQTGRVPSGAFSSENNRLAGLGTHYVIDARPVSYERPSF